MSETTTTKKYYLDLAGLTKYDGLIKEYIAAKDLVITGTLATGDYQTIKALSDAIKSLEGAEANVQADWNETDNTSDAFIKNKPTDLVRDSLTIAGVDLKDNITKAELLTALNVKDGAEANKIESIAVNGVDATITNKKATVTIPEATKTASGVMSASDKTKLDGIDAGAQVNYISSVGDNLAVDNSGKLTVTIPDATVTGVKENDSVLSLDGTLLTSAISLSYDSSKKEIYLKGKNGTVISTVKADEFIKDGMIDNVAWSTETGKETTLVITFNTDAGKSAVNVDFKKLVDEYTSGNGIDVNGKVVSVKIANATKDAVTLSATATGLSATLSGWDDTKAKVDALDTNYAAKNHTHSIDDITDFEAIGDGAIKGLFD